MASTRCTAAAKRFEAAKSALETGNFSASNFEAQYVARAAAGPGRRKKSWSEKLRNQRDGPAAEDLLTVISRRDRGKLLAGHPRPDNPVGAALRPHLFGQPQGAKYGVSSSVLTTPNRSSRLASAFWKTQGSKPATACPALTRPSTRR